MLYIFFAIACMCSHSILAMQKEQQDKLNKKAHYDEIISKIKDDKERAKYAEGYIVVGQDKLIIPISEVYLPIPIGNDGCFMSFPVETYSKIMSEMELNKEKIKNNNKLELTK